MNVRGYDQSYEGPGLGICSNIPSFVPSVADGYFMHICHYFLTRLQRSVHCWFRTVLLLRSPVPFNPHAFGADRSSRSFHRCWPALLGLLIHGSFATNMLHPPQYFCVLFGGYNHFYQLLSLVFCIKSSLSIIASYR